MNFPFFVFVLFGVRSSCGCLGGQGDIDAPATGLAADSDHVLGLGVVFDFITGHLAFTLLHLCIAPQHD